MVKKSGYNGPRNSRIKRQRAIGRRKKMMIRPWCSGSVSGSGGSEQCLHPDAGWIIKTKNQDHITSMEVTIPQKLKEINGISVKGLGYEKTVAALIKGYDWNLSVSYEGKNGETGTI